MFDKPFCDEQELIDRFEELCGGYRNAERLQQVWNTSYPHRDYDKELSREQVFKRRAKAEGFTRKQINAFLALP